MFQSQALTSAEAQTVARGLVSLKTHLCVAGEAHMVHQHCDREQGLGPSCVVAPLGSILPSLEAGADCAGPSDMWRRLRAYINHSMLVYFLSP